MKRFLLVLVCLLCSLFTFATSYRVLFIGNSYTEVNNLPQLVADIAQSTGDEITFMSHTPGGCTFQQHLAGAMSYIREGGWDYVVLQEQSQLPSFPESQFMSQCYPYAKQLCDSIREYNPDAKIVFYMTWGRKNGDAQNCPYFPPLCTYEGMDSLLHARYMIMAADNQTLVSPVGHVWHYIRDHHPEIELYQADESHPSLAGSYAAACSFYATFFAKDPTGIQYDANLPDETTRIIRETTSQLVFDSLSSWSFLPLDDDTVGIPLIYDEADMFVSPNPASYQVVVSFGELYNESTELYLYNQGGQLVRRTSTTDEFKVVLPLYDLPDGIYFLQARQPHRLYRIHKIVKVSR